MPEAYTHIRTGRRAAADSGWRPACPAAFALGCQGPDLLFCYQVWKPGKKRDFDLPALGNRMHGEKTGAFLRALVELAKTDAEISYAAGFLCHYGADCTLHPYAGFVTQPGQLYGMAGGHGYFEAALDSLLHRADFGSAAVLRRHSCPPVPSGQLKEISRLLRRAVKEVFGLDIPARAFADSYRHTRLLRGIFVSRLGIKRGIFWLAERLAFGGPGFITGHVTPARLRRSLPVHWQRLGDGQPMEGDVFFLLGQARIRCCELLRCYADFLAGRTDAQQLYKTIGSNGYDTGLPCE